MDSIPQVDIPDESDQRFSVLSFEQVKRLSDLMSEVIPIHGRGNFPTLEVRLCDLIRVVRARLEEDGVNVAEVRLNGSGASSVLAADFAHVDYNDLDLIFSVDLSGGVRAFDRIKNAVLESLMQLLPEGVSRKRMSSCSMKEAYVSKMVKVNDSDRWSLITLGNNKDKTVELKFVHNMRRQYEFSVDSFHVLLDTLFLFYDCAKGMAIGENFYPTVVGESMYGDFQEALYHLHKKLIATRNPEEIRGGGLLKYCNLLAKAYRPAWPEEVKQMERYMCSRFFIDFPDIRQQQAKLENYLVNHFHGCPDRLKCEYLMILHAVVDESTVCLMGLERRLTLSLIEDMAYQIYPEPYSTLNHPGEDPNLLSPMSVCSDASSTISTASSAPSSGYATPQKPDTPTPAHNNNTGPHVVGHNNSHHVLPPPPQPTFSASVCTCCTMIPTYEIVTSCQPAVVYSNGYYYTSFLGGSNQAGGGDAATVTKLGSVPASTAFCLACSCCGCGAAAANAQRSVQTCS